MKREIIHIPVERYIAPDGYATCALNFKEGEICMFLKAVKYGTHHVCLILDDSSLERRDNGCGFLTPPLECPVWIERKKND